MPISRALQKFARILQRRWWIVVVAIAFTATGALTFSLLQRPRYQARAEIVIEPAQPNLDLAQSAKLLLRTYMTVADSDEWAQRVIDELAIPMTPERLRRDVRFAAEEDRMVITLDVEGYDGAQANDIALAWANLLIGWRESQNQRQDEGSRVLAYLRDQPRYIQVWPKTGTFLLAGSITGLVIGALIVFLLEWAAAGVVRTPEELERGLDLIVIGAIPPAGRRRT